MIVETSLFSEEVPEKGIIDGHVRFTLSSSQPDDVAVVAMCANFAASVLFDRLKAQGTNIIFSLRDDGGRMDVVARNTNDGITLDWPPKKTDAAKLTEVHSKLSDKMLALVPKKKDIAKQEHASGHNQTGHDGHEGGNTNTSHGSKHHSDDEDEQLVKILRRIP